MTFIEKKIKPGLSFILVAHNNQDSIYQSLMSIVDIADEIIFLDINSSDNSLSIAKEIAQNYPSVLKIYSNKKLLYDVESEEKHYYKWCLSKASRYNIINWEPNCIADTEKLRSLIRNHNLRNRNDKFCLYISGETVLREGENYYSIKLGKKLERVICYSKFNYSYFDMMSNRVVPSPRYLKKLIKRKPEGIYYYRITTNQEFKGQKKEKLPIANLFLPREYIKNRPLFLIGSGPSLREHDISKLKNCYTMSFNRSYIAFDDWGFQPTYFAGLDNVVNEDNKDAFINLIHKSRIKRFFFPNDSISQRFFKSKNVSIIDIYGGNPRGPDLNFTTNLTTANSGLFGLQIAIGLLGFKEIYLLGCDANYKEQIRGTQKKDGVYISMEDNDTNHFRQDYFGKGTTYNKPNSTKWHYPAWKSFFEENLINNEEKVKVYNCSSSGKLTFFEFKNFNDITKDIKSFEIE